MGGTVNTFCDAKRAGIYVCTTCGDAEQRLEEGEEAPHCENCKRPVTWEFRRPVTRQPIGFIPS
jgi:hypothetical protein